MRKCVSMSGRHKWQSEGLDIVRDELVNVRKCVHCHARQDVKYKAPANDFGTEHIEAYAPDLGLPK